MDSPTASGLATPPPAAALNQSRLVNSYVPSVSGFQPPCDLTAERALCLFGGQKVIVPDATPKARSVDIHAFVVLFFSIAGAARMVSLR